LDGRACEASAIRLEKKVKKIPGVRKATATYIGKILCLTFDENIADEKSVIDSLRALGARISAYQPVWREGEEGLWTRVKSGSLNEEISCALGFLFLIASLIADHSIGKSAVATWILYAGAYFFCGQQGVRSAIASLRERVLDVDVLMVLAAIGAGIVGQPFEGALLLFLFCFSNVLQSYALQRTQKAIHSLLKLRPDKALVKRSSGNELVKVEELAIGDIVILRPGEHVPVDGTVVEGSGHIDESSLTGESMPVSKSSGSTIFAGTLNQSGGLEFSVTKRAEDSTLARMVKLVEEAQAEKSGTQRFLEQAAADLGATPWRTFRLVTFPLILPGVLAASLLAFALSIDDFIITFFNAGSTVTFPLQIYGAARVRIPPQINVLASLVLFASVALLVVGTLRGRKAPDMSKRRVAGVLRAPLRRRTAGR
jgi:Cd2+/Zn2+-exporting ATPase